MPAAEYLIAQGASVFSPYLPQFEKMTLGEALGYIESTDPRLPRPVSSARRRAGSSARRWSNVAAGRFPAIKVVVEQTWRPAAGARSATRKEARAHERRPHAHHSGTPADLKRAVKYESRLTSGDKVPMEANFDLELTSYQAKVARNPMPLRAAVLVSCRPRRSGRRRPAGGRGREFRKHPDQGGRRRATLLGAGARCDRRRGDRAAMEDELRSCRRAHRRLNVSASTKKTGEVNILYSPEQYSSATATAVNLNYRASDSTIHPATTGGSGSSSTPSMSRSASRRAPACAATDRCRIRLN